MGKSSNSRKKYLPEDLEYAKKVRARYLDEFYFNPETKVNRTPAEMVQEALKDPAKARRELVKSICYDDLYEFVKMAWPILEPNVPMVESRAMREVCKALQAVTEGKIKRLLINIPPGFAKTALVCVFWPAWEWGPRGLSHYRYIGASYEQGLATDAQLRSRRLILSQWFQDLWPMEMREDQNEKTYYGNNHTGWRKSTSVGGALTGYRGDRILIDDPHDVKRAHSTLDRQTAIKWWTQTVPTRLNSPRKSAIVVIMQRLHIDDIAGHILKHTPESWTTLILPMEYEPERHCSCPEIGFEDWRTTPGELLWPEQFTREVVDEMKKSMSSEAGMYAVASQFQQSPVPETGGMFDPTLATVVDFVPSTPHRRARGWDLAATEGGGDYTSSARLCIIDGIIYIEDVMRFQGGPHRVKTKLLETAESDSKTTPISLPQDPGQAGKHQKSYLASVLEGWDVHFSLESGSKADRARPLSAQWAAGNVRLVKGTWNDVFLAEAKLFPSGGKHDDMIDACTRAYAYLLAQESNEGISTNSGYAVENPTSEIEGY